MPCATMFRPIAAALVALLLASCGAASSSAPAEQATSAATMADAPTATAEAMADAPTATAAAMADAPTATAEAMADAPTATAEAMADAPTATAEAMTEPQQTPANVPVWQQVALSDARSGQQFTLADFAGKTVYVEPMATWCSNCRKQLGNLRVAQPKLGDNVVLIGLSVETTISAADLAAYADAQGFDWTFAVATPALLQQLSDTFGRTITNPPSTPHFIIYPDGSASELLTGYSSPEDIISLVQQ